MSAQFITADVWGALSRAARRSKKPAYVAVAYFGKGAADLLCLPAKSRLVVDASEAAVKQGQTNPAELRRMLRRKVAVYSVQNLHAKVFAFDTAAFIGSANVSKHSASVLQEAVLRVTDAKVLRATRDFVKDLCLEPLGPKELTRLQKLYRPPRFVPGKHKARGQKQRFSTLRVVHTRSVDVADKLEEAFEVGHKEAVKKRPYNSGFAIEEFYWSNPSPFREGQLVIQVYKNAHGRSVSPPGHVIHTRSYRDGKERKTLIYAELPDRYWEPLSRFGAGMKKILSCGGVKNYQTTNSLLAFWRSKLMSFELGV
jgi:hypothetical protein